MKLSSAVASKVIENRRMQNLGLTGRNQLYCNLSMEALEMCMAIVVVRRGSAFIVVRPWQQRQSRHESRLASTYVTKWPPTTIPGYTACILSIVLSHEPAQPQFGASGPS